jgi:Spy/CpxP family protein refolding chaperone
MRKVLTIVLAVMLAFVFTSASFAADQGPAKGKNSVQEQKWTPEQKAKFVKFQNDILPLKQKMLQLRTELMTLKMQTPADWSAIAAKKHEMVDVKIAIQKKAAEAGIKGWHGHKHGMKGQDPKAKCGCGNS